MKQKHNVVRAIDVGYFNTKYSLGRKAQDDGSVVATGLMPSIVTMMTKEACIAARQSQTLAGYAVEVEDVCYYVGGDAPAMQPIPVLEDYATSAAYLALVRGSLHAMADDAGLKDGDELVIDHLVLGLPLNTINKYEQSLIERVLGEHRLLGAGVAGDDAARRVTVHHVHVIPQPLGALLDIGATGQTEGWTLILDAGGGVLNWLFASNGRPNYRRSGAYPKGMLECAYTVTDQINPNWRYNMEVVGHIDTAIRKQEKTFCIEDVQYELADLMPHVNAVIRQAVDVMLERLGSTDDVDQFVVTGGAATVFRAHLAKRRPDLERVLKIGTAPLFANVRGFHLHGMNQGIQGS